MRYLILGLGIYGSNLARDLTDMGHEIIGVDYSQSNIDAIKDYISTVYLIDVTDESQLSLLPLNNVDLVIVAIGENFGASIKVVAMLKKMKVKHIYARAIDELHESILSGFDIDRIITPEQRAARDLSHEMALGSNVQSLAIDPDHYVLRFKMPEKLYGLKYADLDFEQAYKLRLIAVAKYEEKTNLLGIKQKTLKLISDISPDDIVEEGDVATCLGSRKNYYAFFRTLS